MESKLPSQRTALLVLTPQTVGMFEMGKITWGLGQSSLIFQTTVCKANNKKNRHFD